MDSMDSSSSYGTAILLYTMLCSAVPWVVSVKYLLELYITCTSVPEEEEVEDWEGEKYTWGGS